MRIELEVSENNEGNDSPWWILIDPRAIKQMLEGVAECGDIPSDDSIITTIAMASIEGPFFSRESGEAYLKARHYEYSKDAVIWCSSGYWSQEYKTAWREAREALKETV